MALFPDMDNSIHIKLENRQSREEQYGHRVKREQWTRSASTVTHQVQ